MSNIKSGRWRGQKAKYANPNHRRVPRTGATAALKDWVTKQDAPFLSDAALAAMPHFTQRQLQNAFTVLKRRSVIRETGGWVCRSKVWEVIK
jgi:hypothetical protein